MPENSAYQVPIPLRNMQVPVHIKVSRSVHSYIDRDAIPAEERIGEFISFPVYVEAAKEFFMLVGGITNDNWELVDFLNGGTPGEAGLTSWIDPPVDEVVDALPADPDPDYRVILTTDNSVQEYVTDAWVPQVGPGSDLPLADGMAVVVKSTDLGLNRLHIFNAESSMWEDKGPVESFADLGRYLTNFVDGQRQARNLTYISDIRTITQSGFYIIYDPITNGPTLEPPLPEGEKQKLALLQVITRNPQSFIYLFFRIFQAAPSILIQSCYAGTFSQWITVGSSTLVADQILAADTKVTPANADVFTYVDSAEGFTGLLRKFTWANLKTVLKAYFDTVYSTFFPETEGDGTKFLSDAGDYREAGGGGGGHTIEDNTGTALEQRETLKFSGFLTATDNATTETTEADIDPDQIEEYEEVPVFQVPITARALLEDTGNWTTKEYTGATLNGCVAGMIHYDDDYVFLFVTDTKPIRTARA